MKLHYHLLTIGEPETYRLLCWIGLYKSPWETLTVWTDRVTPEERRALAITASAFPNVTLRDVTTIGSAQRLNRILRETPAGDWVMLFDADEWVDAQFFHQIHNQISLAAEHTSIALPRVNLVYGDSDPTIPPCAFPPDGLFEKQHAYPDYQIRVIQACPDCPNHCFERPRHAELIEPNVFYAKDRSVHLLHHKRFDSYQTRLKRRCMEIARPGYTWDYGIAEEVYLHNCYRILPEHLDGIVIDIGAHVGSFSCLALDLSNRAKVWAYEASPANYAYLHRNLGLYPMEVYACYHRAVWCSNCEPGVMSFQDFAEGQDVNTGGGFIWEDGNTKVETIPLDTILKQAEEVAVLKLDCEGSEYPILYTSKELKRCKRIVLEYHNQTKLGVEGRLSNDAELAVFLEKDQGFKVERRMLTKNNELGILIAHHG